MTQKLQNGTDLMRSKGLDMELGWSITIYMFMEDLN